MASNTQVTLGKQLHVGDIDGDGNDEFVVIHGRVLEVLRPTWGHEPVLRKTFPTDIARLIIGDFVTNGRESGAEQLVVELDDGRTEWLAISDDRTELWWGLTQPRFLLSQEHAIVGDFDGDGADEILAFNPHRGTTRLIKKQARGFSEVDNYRAGNLTKLDLRNKLLLAGEFNGKTDNTDLLVIDLAQRSVSRFAGVVDGDGDVTFWWAFTTRGGMFERGGIPRVVNIDGGTTDDLMVWNPRSRSYDFLKLAWDDGALRDIGDVERGQLPAVDAGEHFVGCRVRGSRYDHERQGTRRHDLVVYDPTRDVVVVTHGREDRRNNKLTYWWAYTSDRLTERHAPLSRPWAVILCRFNDTATDRGIEDQFRNMFSVGSGGVIDYWHDVSLGRIDMAGTIVTEWVTLDISRSEASSLDRGELIDRAIQAAQRAGIETQRGFHSQIAVFTHDFSRDGAPSGADWRDPTWGKFWIDGSADAAGRVSAPPHAQSGSFLAHEIGHGLGLPHDRAADLTTQYGDRFSIMSAMNVRTFRHPDFAVSFGPSLSLPHLVSNGWMYNGRLATPAWSNGTIDLELGTLDDRTTPSALGGKIRSANGRFDYFIEYQRPTRWNQGINDPTVIIRRMVPRAGRTPAFLASIEVPTDGTEAATSEVQGATTFSVQQQGNGRTVKVTAKRT